MQFSIVPKIDAEIMFSEDDTFVRFQTIDRRSVLYDPYREGYGEY